MKQYNINIEIMLQNHDSRYDNRRVALEFNVVQEEEDSDNFEKQHMEAIVEALRAARNQLLAHVGSILRAGQIGRSNRNHAIAMVVRDWIHEQPWSQCGLGSDTCPDWPKAYELADLIEAKLSASFD